MFFHSLFPLNTLLLCIVRFCLLCYEENFCLFVLVLPASFIPLNLYRLDTLTHSSRAPYLLGYLEADFQPLSIVYPTISFSCASACFSPANFSSWLSRSLCFCFYLKCFSTSNLPLPSSFLNENLLLIKAVRYQVLSKVVRPQVLCNVVWNPSGKDVIIR